MKSLHLILLPDAFAVCRLNPDAAIPTWATASNIFSITRTHDELFILCLQSLVPDDVRFEADWRCFRFAGGTNFSQVGILASLVRSFAEAGVITLPFSTCDTDYLLVKQIDLEKATAALRQEGHTIQ